MTPAPKPLRIALWIAQALVGVAFVMTGSMKLMTPLNDLAAQMAWVNHVPAWSVPIIGSLEIAGGIGVLLPSLTRILPKLTPLAALGLVLVMTSAAALHVSIGEPMMTVPNMVLGGLAAFVAWGRFSRAPIAAR